MAVLMITWACGAFNRSLCFCKAAAKKNGDGNAAWEKMLRPESLDCGNGVRKMIPAPHVCWMPQLAGKRRNVPFPPACFPCLQGECRLPNDGKLGRRGIHQFLELHEVGD